MLKVTLRLLHCTVVPVGITAAYTTATQTCTALATAVINREIVQSCMWGIFIRDTANFNVIQWSVTLCFTSLNHNEICHIPYENDLCTGLRNLCNVLCETTYVAGQRNLIVYHAYVLNFLSPDNWFYMIQKLSMVGYQPGLKLGHRGNCLPLQGLALMPLDHCQPWEYSLPLVGLDAFFYSAQWL